MADKKLQEHECWICEELGGRWAIGHTRYDFIVPYEFESKEIKEL